MVNAFFNNQQKYSAKSVFNDRVVTLKNLNALRLVLHSLLCYDERWLQDDLYFKFYSNLFEIFSQSPPALRLFHR